MSGAMLRATSGGGCSWREGVGSIGAGGAGASGLVNFAVAPTNSMASALGISESEMTSKSSSFIFWRRKWVDG